MAREYGRRLLLLVAGLALSAAGVALVLQANVGLEPWSVLHQGMSLFFGISYGTAAMLTGALVLVLALLGGES
ncbi:MAG: hypothetical protein IKN53_02065, partial [Oscillibacter sp.]|nr:hypothetical protein [Oscillibacter sp.]